MYQEIVKLQEKHQEEILTTTMYFSQNIDHMK